MQGQFPCPECQNPIIVLLHRPGARARCVVCSALVPVPDTVNPLDVPAERVDDESYYIAPFASRKDTIVADIASGLQVFDGLVHRVGDGIVEVPAVGDNGFPVLIAVFDSEILLSCGQWQTHFTDIRSALLWFGWALTRRCRLKQGFIGSVMDRVALEFFDGAKWQTVSELERFIIPLFRKRREILLQNDHVPVE